MNEMPKVPAWYWLVCIVCFTWNLLGLSEFVQYLMISPDQLEGMTAEEREMFISYPLWAKVAFGFAVIGGTLGCAGLIIRKAWSKPVLILSFIGVITQMIHSVFISGAMDVYGPGAMVMPVMVVIIGGFLIWFADFGIKKSWIR